MDDDLEDDDASDDGDSDLQDGDVEINDDDTNLAPAPPADNINGSSGTNGNASPSLYAAFGAGAGVSSILDTLTGGAESIGNGISGFFDPIAANTDNESSSTISSSTLLIGGAVILGIVVLIAL